MTPPGYSLGQHAAFLGIIPILGQGCVPAAHLPCQYWPKQTPARKGAWLCQMLSIDAPFAPLDVLVQGKVLAELFLETSPHQQGEVSAPQSGRGGGKNRPQMPQYPSSSPVGWSKTQQQSSTPPPPVCRSQEGSDQKKERRGGKLPFFHISLLFCPRPQARRDNINSFGT